jgi:hypothetical protein
MSSRYRPPELLAGHHDPSRFQCRSREQTDWLRRFARQSSATGTTKVLVVTEGSGRVVVVAYYAWCMAQITAAAAPERLRRGAGRHLQVVPPGCP